MADENRCPNCGAERAANALGGHCPRCLMQTALDEDTQAPVNLADAAGTIAHDGGGSVEPTLADIEATKDLIDATVAAADQNATLEVTHRVAAATHSDDRASRADAEATQAVEIRKGDRNLARGEKISYIGDYEVQKELGRGGMGVVYQARQVSLNRPVALKLIKAGILADESELRRFQNEAEAVALLDHPGIVPVYEVGEHEGRRYFSMKLVEGGNLAEQLARFKDDSKAAMILLAEVAEAVHHAHMRGILHRDMKPANILIDAAGHPHVTDFGLAKRVEADIEMTASGAILGTPAYMSPEQAAGRRGTITTATDVYGLGSILYALVTGKAPFGGDSVMDTLQAVKEKSPEPPRKLNKCIPRDLEVIVLKCLEKDPRRRYSSAQALADDLRRLLEGRPITARAVGPIERATLWCKRKPAIAALIAAVLLAAVGGTAGVIAVQARANRVLMAKNVELAIEKGRVQQRFELAQQAIRTFHSGVSEDVLLKQKEFAELRTKLLRGARDFYRKLENLLQEQTDRTSRMALGKAYLEVSEITASIETRAAAGAIARDAVSLFEALSREDPSDREAKRELGRSLNAFASIRTSQDGGAEEGLAAFEKAREILEPLAKLEPSDNQARSELAITYEALSVILPGAGDQPNTVLELIGNARAIREGLAQADPANAELLSQLASLCSTQALRLMALGHADEAIATHQRAIDILEGLFRANPTDAGFAHALARAIGNQQVSIDPHPAKEEERLERLERARSLCGEMAKIHPTLLNFPRDQAWIDLAIAENLMRLNRDEEALPPLEEARALREELLKVNPNDVRNQSQLHKAFLRLRALHARSGRLQEAREARKHAIEVRDRLVRFNGNAHELLNGLASDLTNLSDLLRQGGRPETALARAAEAAEGFREAITLRERLVKEHPELPIYRGHLAYSLRKLGQVEHALGDPNAQVAMTLRAIGLLESILPTKDDELNWEYALCHAALAGLAGVPGSQLSAEVGASESDRAMDLLRKLAQDRTGMYQWYRDDPALDALRPRSDFPLLLLDFAMPANPFVR